MIIYDRGEVRSRPEIAEKGEYSTRNEVNQPKSQIQKSKLESGMRSWGGQEKGVIRAPGARMLASLRRQAQNFRGRPSSAPEYSRIANATIGARIQLTSRLSSPKFRLFALCLPVSRERGGVSVVPARSWDQNPRRAATRRVVTGSSDVCRGSWPGKMRAGGVTEIGVRGL